jgi:hypothetical protein
VVNISGYMADKLLQTVFFVNTDFQSNGRGIVQQTVAPCLVFLPGMDIGVVPECYRFNALAPQRFDAGERTGSAAGMKQNRTHGNPYNSSVPGVA